MAKTSTAATPKDKGATSANPLFYNKPTLITVDAHKKSGLNKDLGFGFAKGANAIPVNLVEFPQLAHYYPIAFARDAVATPVAIVGVRNDENLFVDAKGQWTPNTYIPAYARRYPFILSESTGSDQLSLCIDDANGALSAKGDAFFDDKGQPSQMSKNALDFCRSYHQAAQQSQEFGKALAAADILVDRTAEITVKGGQRITFSGFRIVDEAKFNALPEKTFMEWRAKGYLAGVYAHLFSGLHWGTITRLVNERLPDAKK